MGETQFKKSFLLNTDLIDPFIQYLKKCRLIDLPGGKKYRKFDGKLDNYGITVYSSGIVLFDSSSQVDKIVSEFFNQLKINLPLIEKINNFEQQNTPHKSNWKHVPKSIWLSRNQRRELVKHLNASDEVIFEDPHHRYEEMRFKKAKQSLVLNANGTVYTVGGFEGFMDLMRVIIYKYPLFSGYDYIINLQEFGRKSALGPVIVGCMASTIDEINNWQLKGIKHSSIGRSPRISELSKEITNSTEKYSLELIEPQKFNKANKEIGKDEIERIIISSCKKSFRKVISMLNALDIKKNKILIHTEDKIWTQINAELPPYLSIAFDIKYIEQSSSEFSALSVLAQEAIETWTGKKEIQFGVKIQRNNIQNLRKLPFAKEIIKQQEF
ncbi:MAG: hypothetical protein ACXAD7_04040 [Candidatus Kariarchaeaceae archaeon]|jgi:ribonuclease HIII